MKYPSVIGIVGPIRSGKSTVSDYLSRSYGYRVASNAEVLREIAEKIGMSMDRNSLSKLGDAIFSTLGNNAIALYRVSQNHDQPTVIDGIRYLEEVDTYAKLPSFKLLGVMSGDKARYLRTMALRNTGKDRDLTEEQFLSLSGARSEQYVPRLLQRADHVIENMSTLQRLEIAVDEIMSAWQSSAYA